MREKAGKKKKDGKKKNVQQKEDKRVSEEGLSGGMKVEDNKSREKEKTVDQKKKEDYIIRKVDKIVNRGDDITVCLPGKKIEDIAEKAGQVIGGGTGGVVFVHVGTNNAEKEGTSAIIGKYRRLINTLKEARIV